MTAHVRKAMFEPFSWLSDDLRNDSAALFAARVKDLGSGVHTCLQLIEISELQREHGADQEPPEVPLLSVCDASRLMRLAITATKIMSEQAEEFFQAAQNRHERARQGKSDAGGNHE